MAAGDAEAFQEFSREITIKVHFILELLSEGFYWDWDSYNVKDLQESDQE